MTAGWEPGAPIKVQVTRWRCPFCGRSHSGSSRARQHIARCWFNPGVRSCKTCVNFRENYGNGAGCAAGLVVDVPTDRPNVFKLPVGCPSWTPDNDALDWLIGDES